MLHSVASDVDYYDSVHPNARSYHAEISQLIYEFLRTALLFKIPSEMVNQYEATTYYYIGIISNGHLIPHFNVVLTQLGQYSISGNKICYRIRLYFELYIQA